MGSVPSAESTWKDMEHVKNIPQPSSGQIVQGASYTSKPSAAAVAEGMNHTSSDITTVNATAASPVETGATKEEMLKIQDEVNNGDRDLQKATMILAGVAILYLML